MTHEHARRSRQKSRLLPAETEALSEKAQGATFSHRLGQTLARSDESHERILQAAFARLDAQLLRCPTGDDSSVSNHHHVVAKRSHFLHYVTGEQHAVAFVAQPRKQAA